MDKKHTVKKNQEITQILNINKTVSSQSFRIFTKQNEINHYRFAISVGKKISKKAVDRNYQKRRLREIIHQCENLYLKNDYFIICKPCIITKTYIELKKEFIYIIKKINNISRGNK